MRTESELCAWGRGVTRLVLSQEQRALEEEERKRKQASAKSDQAKQKEVRCPHEPCCAILMCLHGCATSGGLLQQ